MGRATEKKAKDRAAKAMVPAELSFAKVIW